MLTPNQVRQVLNGPGVLRDLGDVIYASNMLDGAQVSIMLWVKDPTRESDFIKVELVVGATLTGVCAAKLHDDISLHPGESSLGDSSVIGHHDVNLTSNSGDQGA